MANNQTDDRLLLDTQFSSVGVVGDKGPHVYLKIYQSGKIQYDKRINAEIPAQYQHVEDQLSPDDLNNVKSLLDSSDIINIGKHYSLKNKSVDRFINLKIAIFRDGGEQEIDLSNFRGDFSKDKPHFNEIKKLVCMMEKLRKAANYTILDNPEEFCQQ